MRWVAPRGMHRGNPFTYPCCHQSEDGRWIINRAPQDGYVPRDGTITYMLVDTASKPSRIVAVERDVPDDHDAKLAAIHRLKQHTGDLNA